MLSEERLREDETKKSPRTLKALQGGKLQQGRFCLKRGGEDEASGGKAEGASEIAVAKEEQIVRWWPAKFGK